MKMDTVDNMDVAMVDLIDELVAFEAPNEEIESEALSGASRDIETHCSGCSGSYHGFSGIR
jgi:hypothetical protein